MSAGHGRAFFDPYSRLDSPVHALPTAVKLFSAFALVLALVAAPQRLAVAAILFPAAALLLVGITAAARLPPLFLLKRMVQLEPVVLGALLLTLFQPGGVHRFAWLFARTALCMATMLILANTTAFTDILALLRRLHAPAILVTTAALMYRYLFVLVDESQRMRRARASRTFSPSRRLAWTQLASAIAHLFVRAAERADRIYLAMLARGWR